MRVFVFDKFHRIGLAAEKWRTQAVLTEKRPLSIRASKNRRAYEIAAMAVATLGLRDFTHNDAWRVAVNFAELPELLRQPKS